MRQRPPTSPLFPYTTLFRSRIMLQPVLEPHDAERHAHALVPLLAGQPGQEQRQLDVLEGREHRDRKSTRLNSSHSSISYAVFCLKKKKQLTRKSRRASMQLT